MPLTLKNILYSWLKQNNNSKMYFYLTQNGQDIKG